MKRQMDIFGGGASSEKTRAKKSSPRKPRKREVKKAPLILDSYSEESGTRDSGPGTRDSKSNSGIKDSVSRITNPESRVTSHESRPFSVSQITELIKGNLESSFSDVWVCGEVTNFKGRRGPHAYFALKDESSQINAIIFGTGNGRLRFELEDGLKLVCRGKVNVYAPRGNYSLIIDPAHCQPEGIGALKLAFEQLKKKLEAEGLFDKNRKQPLPYLPRRVGIVTASTGAAIRDMINVLTRRYPNIEILLHPARVQGDGAAEEIAAAVAALNRVGNLDVLIVGRGGGSMEDLWCFNEEIVARAIAASQIPVVSAVGHEIDFTIADFVADVRAATPSAAAEIVVPVRADLARRIAENRERLAGGLRRLLEHRALELGRLKARLGDPSQRLPDLFQRVDAARQRLIYTAGVKLKDLEQRIAKLASNLDHLSPLSVLAKGYAVVQGPDGHALKTASGLKAGDPIDIRFEKGGASAKITKVLP